MKLFKKIITAVLCFGLITVPNTLNKETKVVEAADIAGDITFYLKPNSNWKQSSARFSIYFFNNSTNKNAWVSMTDSNKDGIYEAVSPSGSWKNLIFCRMNGSTTANNWNNKWNQTGDLTYDGIKNFCTINDGQWDCGTNVTWGRIGSYYNSDTEVKLVGDFNDWGKKTPTYIFDKGIANPGETSETYVYKYSKKNIELSKGVNLKINSNAVNDNWIGDNYIEPDVKTSAPGIKFNKDTDDNNIEVTQDAIYNFEFKTYQDNGRDNPETGYSIYIEQYQKVTFNVNGNQTEEVVKYNTKLAALPEVESKEGYSVVWYNGDKVFTSDELIKENITLTAKYEANSYKITYDYGYDKEDKTIDVTYNSSITLENPTREGYTFSHWTYNGEEFNSGTYNKTEDITLKAVWNIDTYEINYILNGGTNNPNNPSEYNYETETITLLNPSKEGYKFLGWTSEDVLEPTIGITIPKNSTGDKTFEAHWEQEKYNVTFVIGENKYVEEVYHGTLLSEVLPETSLNIVSWDKEINSKVTSEMTVTATAYYANSTPTVELGFNYTYNTISDAVVDVKNLKMRFSSGYIDSNNLAGDEAYGITVSYGDGAKTNTQTWTKDELAKYNKTNDNYVLDDNGNYYKWNLVLNNIPKTFWDTEFTFETFVTINGENKTIGKRTISIKDAAQTYVDRDMLKGNEKESCEYLAGVGYAASQEDIISLLEDGVKTVVLTQDIEVDELIVENKQFTLDLNGYAINATKAPVKHVTDKGEEYTALYGLYAKNGSVVNIVGNGSIYGGTGASDNTALRASGGSVINIYNGTFTTGVEIDENGETSGETTVYCTDNSIVNIYGGTFSTEKAYDSIYFVLNPEVNSKAQFNIYGGTFINYNPTSNYTGMNFVKDGYKVNIKEVGNDTHYTIVKA